MRLPSRNQAFWTSVVLHCVVLLGFFLVTVVQALKPKDEPHVFVMFDPPAAEGESSNPPEELPPMELELPAVPEMPEIEPVVLPDPPVPVRPRPDAPTRPTEVVQPPAERPLMTMEDFLKEHTIREPRQPRPRPPVTQEQIRIDTDRIQRELDAISRDTPSPTDSSSLSQATQLALARYNAKLRARIDGAWVKPANLTGVRLNVEVIFDVSASGRISNVRLRGSSGNASFDQSVLSAFAKVSSAGPTPSGLSHTFSMRFRMADS